MRFLSKLFGRSQNHLAAVAPVPPVLSEGARAFLEGRKGTLTSADIDPENSAYVARYEDAMARKRQNDLLVAERLLRQSCEPPSIYKGHYRELFRIWREFNRRDLADGLHQTVVDRVLTMIRYDDELIAEMLSHWSKVQQRVLPPDIFENSRNLLVSDAKALHKAATALGNSGAQDTATGLLDKFNSTTTTTRRSSERSA